MRWVDRVFLVILENENAGAALQQPFLKQLADTGAYLANYHALTHPSQPNYIALTNRLVSTSASICRSSTTPISRQTQTAARHTS